MDQYFKSKAQIWDDFVFKYNGSFLQSYEWGEFQKLFNKEPFYLIFKENQWYQVNPLELSDCQNIKSLVLVLKHNLPFKKSYFYLPKPIFSHLKPENQLSSLIDFLSKNTDKGAMFVKIEPFKTIDFNKSTQSSNIQPKQTLVLDLSLPEADLLNQMHPKTRYNIKLAQKYGVVIEDGSVKDLDKFWELMDETSSRDKFKSHSKNYYKELLNAMPFAKLKVARLKNKILAAMIIVFFDKTVYYLHGASSYEFRHVMAPHLLQWSVILEAKKQGFLTYDFWGIDEKKWPGVTRFKKGFGGKIVDYPYAFDFVFDKFWYWLYRLIRKIKRFG